MTRYFVGLGSNLGDRIGNLRGAVARIDAMPDVEVRRRSQIWETRPLGPGSGPFVNAAIEVVTELAPEDMLGRLLDIEIAYGRIRRQRWGDRTLDLDLLCAFDNGHEVRRADGGLKLPHPGLTERDFVLQPLLDIDAELRVSGRGCVDWLASIDHAGRTLLRSLERL